MAIKAKLEKNVNVLKKELENVYIRIDNFTVFLKQGFIQVGVKGYLDAESGAEVSAYEAGLKERIEDLFKDKKLRICNNQFLQDSGWSLPPYSEITTSVGTLLQNGQWIFGQN